MSETREEFRERIAETHDAAYHHSLRKGKPPPTDPEGLWIRQNEALADAAEAVYAECLRDVRALVELEDVFCLVPADIDQFAAELGLDLDEQS